MRLLFVVLITVLITLVVVLVSQTKCPAGEKKILDKAASIKLEKVKQLDTSDWKIYVNEKYGYKIKYPREFICDDSHKKHVMFGSKVMPYISVDVYNNTNNIEIEEFVSQLLKNGLDSLLNLSNVTWRRITVSGINGLQASFRNVVGGYSGRVSWDYVQNRGKVYRIALYQNFGQWSYSELHNMLISTFVFLGKLHQ